MKIAAGCTWSLLVIGLGIGAFATQTPSVPQPTGTKTPMPGGGGTVPVTKTRTPDPGVSTSRLLPEECSNCKIYECAGGAARHRNHFSTQKVKSSKKKKRASSTRSSKDITVGKYKAESDVKYKDFEKWCKAGANVIDYGATAPVIWAKDSDCNDLYHCPAFTPVPGQSKKCGISCSADISGASAVSLLVIVLLIVGCLCCSVAIGVFLFIKAGKKAKEVLEGGEDTGGYDEDPSVYGETDYEMTGAGETAAEETAE